MIQVNLCSVFYIYYSHLVNEMMLHITWPSAMNTYMYAHVKGTDLPTERERYD